MANTAVEELKSSLEWLHSTREFSDLQIVTREKAHRVHKAIVCPRSSYLAGACRQTASNDANNNIIKLFEDDPIAMDAVIHFFYHLDYPSDPSLMMHQDEPETNGSSGVNGVNGDHNHDDSQASVKTEEPSSSLDDFLPISVSKSAMKQRKKRARRKSLSRGPLDPPGTVTEVITLPGSDTAENREEGAPLVQRPAATNGSGYNYSPAETPTAEKNEFGLVFHAKVYHVSRKLGIDSLQALALQKLESETKEQWDSEGFVKAASEISSLMTESELGEGQIRGIILDVLCEHRELINKDGMENVIRGMDLGYDLVKQLTKRGLIAM
ncbi:hypothetical protein VP1G_02812 [Cytospora mali]|uniref:BTB domain-containing protein n=1 Tax=Cytospora mali TaxID=578113 RepID=A0A194UUZ8_CYTMA|nr:hypothetical protein VP1G_02812 [Valsa mali var. pyri (nom. inval.)]